MYQIALKENKVHARSLTIKTACATVTSPFSATELRRRLDLVVLERSRSGWRSASAGDNPDTSLADSSSSLLSSSSSSSSRSSPA
jgi:hypothetical protein